MKRGVNFEYKKAEGGDKKIGYFFNQSDSYCII